MTVYVGGPEDNVFNVTPLDSPSFINGGAGYDILNVDYTGAYGFDATLDFDDIYITAGHDTYTIDFRDIEFLSLKTAGGSQVGSRVQVYSDQTNALIDGNGEATVRFNFGHEREGRTIAYNPDVVSSVGLVKLQNIRGLEIFGGSGNDVLSAGIDTVGVYVALDGGSGNDILNGSEGDDSLSGGQGMDSVNYGHAAGAVTVSLLGGMATGGAGNDTLSSVENIRGSAYDDVLTGDDGANVLSGLAGADRMTGLGGDDEYWIDGEGDIVVEAPGGGYDRVFAKIDHTQADNFEAVTLLGRSNINAYGNDGDNMLSGNNGNNRIVGGNGNDVIEGGEGSDILSGEGGIDTVSYKHAAAAVQLSLLAGTANGGAGDDQLSGFENILGSAFGDVLTGSAGNNIIEGGEGDDIVSSGEGDDIIEGGEGDDILSGGEGDDIIDGGEGDNQLYGGAGIDRVSYEHAAGAVTASLLGELATGGAGNVTLSGFENIRGSAYADSLTGDDGNNVLSGLGGDDIIEGGKGDDALSGDAGTDSVSYEHAAGAVTVSLLGGVATGVGNDTLSGFENIRGSAYDDVLTGDDGANVLSGLAGADRMTGLGGDDEYWIDGEDDIVVEAPGGGYDRVFAKIDYTLLDNFEAVTLLGRSNINAYGNDGDDMLTGNNGNNRIAGGNGDDVIEGGEGSDILSGEGGIDTASYEHAAAAVQVVLLEGSAFGRPDYYRPIDFQDQLIDFENIRGSAFADVLTGDDGDNVVEGGEENDILSGGAGRDTVSYEHLLKPNTEYTFGVRVSLLTGLASGAGSDTLSDFENIRGSAYWDGLEGDDSSNVLSGLAGGDSLIGRGGDDLIEGGEGNDQVVGGEGNDSVSYQHAAGAVKVSLLDQRATGGAGNDTIDEIENIRGSAFNDVLTGDGNANNLSGLAGADQMRGLGGDDSYWVDNRRDIVVEAPGGGHDRVLTKVDYTLSDDVEDLTLLGQGSIHAYGNEMDNMLTGNSGNNRLVGRGGEDLLIGGAGDDIYHVNSWGDEVVEAAEGGTDLIVSSISIDLLTMPDVENVRLIGRPDMNLNGNAQANVLEGNAGDNVIRGFSGADVLTGGAGADRFGFDVAPEAANVVRITDFSVADDSMLLWQTAFGGIASGPLSASAFALGSVAGDADDRILYDGTSGALFYDADGSGEAAAVQFAALTQGLALTHADFLIV